MGPRRAVTALTVGLEGEGWGSCLTSRAGNGGKWMARAEAGLSDQREGQAATRQAKGQGREGLRRRAPTPTPGDEVHPPLRAPAATAGQGPRVGGFLAAPRQGLASRSALL